MVAAAAGAVLDVVEERSFLDSVARKGDDLRRGLARLSVRNARGRGLMVGFDVDGAPDLASRALLEHRLVINATGPETIRLLPPLTVTDDEIAQALERLGTLLDA